MCVCIGSRLWTRITSSVSDILSSVKRLFNRSHDSNTCPPLMNETDVSTPHTSPTPSQPSSPPPQSPSPKLTHHSTSQQHTPPLLPTTTTTTCSLPLSLPQQISSYSNIVRSIINYYYFMITFVSLYNSHYQESHTSLTLPHILMDTLTLPHILMDTLTLPHILMDTLTLPHIMIFLMDTLTLPHIMIFLMDNITLIILAYTV